MNQSMQIQERLLDIRVTHVFRKIFYTTKRIVVNRGGTRSSKTYSMCQILMQWLFFGEIRQGQYIMEGTAGVFRQYRASCRATVLRDFEEVLTKAGLLGFVKVNKAELSYSFQGRKVEFKGADDLQKLHGYKCEILFLNEADELTWDKFRQLNFRAKYCVFVDFNPKDPYTWINEHLESVWQYKHNNTEVIVSNYQDNPYLSEEQLHDLLITTGGGR